MRSHRSRSSKTSRLARLALLSAVMVPFAGAPAGADLSEADRLKDLFESHLGRPAAGEPSAVAVTRVGDDYEVAIDLDRIAAPLKAFGLELRLGRNVSRLTPRADGTWAWRGDTFDPWTWSAGGQTGTLSLQGYHGEGVFDPAITAFRTQTLKVDRMVSEQTVPPEGETPRITIHKTDEKLELTGTAGAAAGGVGVDATVVQTTGASVETFALSEGLAKGIPDMEATLKVASSRLDGDVKGFRIDPFMALWRHLVAHHAPENFKANQKALKERLSALGPLFDHLHEAATVDGIEIETPVGFGSIGRFTVALDTTGAARRGEFDFKLGLTGLQMHSLFIPGWASPLIPTELTLHAKVSGWDAETPLAVFLEKSDLGADKPLTDEASAEIARAFLPDGSVVIDLSGNHARSAIWDLSLDGSVTAGPGGASGSITVRGVGLDAAASALRDPKAGPDAAGVAAELEQAISLAEHRDGALFWRFDFDGDDVSVNGRSLTGEKKPVAPGGSPQKGETGAPSSRGGKL